MSQNKFTPPNDYYKRAVLIDPETIVRMDGYTVTKKRKNARAMKYGALASCLAVALYAVIQWGWV